MSDTKPKLYWEEVESSPYLSAYIRRAKVPGEWLVMVTENVIHDQFQYGRGMVGCWDWSTSICFVPDQIGEWI
jgi:hypothetical protein